jgi:hypothetical protein
MAEIVFTPEIAGDVEGKVVVMTGTILLEKNQHTSELTGWIQVVHRELAQQLSLCSMRPAHMSTLATGTMLEGRN